MFLVDRPRSKFSIASKSMPVFDFIKVSSGIDDWTLEATVRALLYGRTDENVGVFVCNSQESIRSLVGDGEPDDDAISASVEKDIVNAFADDPGLYIWGWRDIFGAKKLFDWVEENFTTAFQGFRELMDMRMYIKRSVNADAHVYINEDSRVTHVFCRDLTWSVLRILQSLIPRFLPWYFVGHPLTETEVELARSTSKDKPNDYIEALEAISVQKGIRNAIMSQKIKGLVTAGIRVSLSSAQGQMEENEERIHDNMQRYDALMRRREELNTIIAGCEARIASAGNGEELTDYIAHSKAIEVVNIDGDTIEFIVHTCLSNYDPDRYKSYSRNAASSIFSGASGNPNFGNDTDKLRRLLNEVFSPDPVIRVHMCGYYSVSVSGNVNTSSNYSYSTASCKNEIPNPHLQYHACLGDNARYIREPLKNGDLITAIEQCIASAGSVNIDESVSIRPFVRDILRTNIAPFELPDGRRVNALKALEWIDSERSKS